MKTMRVNFVLAFYLIVSLCAGAAEQHVANGLSSLPNEARASISAAMGRDPWVQQAQFGHSHGAGGDQFGYSVAVSGNTVVVGADQIGTAGTGVVYLFVRPPSGWKDMRETVELTASDGARGDLFGASVAVSGDTVVVGAPCATAYQQQCGHGAAYVFVKPVGGWNSMTQTAKLTAPLADQVGGSVSISGDTVVATGYAAYVFVKPSGGWKDATETAELTASDDPAEDFRSVSISGNTIIAGDPVKSSSQGAAYVFVKPASGWTNMTQTAELTASDGGPDQGFGRSVAIGVDTVVAGGFEVRGKRAYGAAYIFVEPPTGWVDTTQTAELTAAYVGKLIGAFIDVAISGKQAFAGQPDHGNSKGAVFVFGEPAGGWKNTSRYSQKLTAATGKHELYFGRSVAVSGNAMAIGAPQGVSPGYPGTAYVFGRAK